MTRTVLLFTDSHSFCGVGKINAVLLAGLAKAGYRTVCAQKREDTQMQDRLRQAGVDYVWFDYDPDQHQRRFINDTEMAARVINAVRPDLFFFANGTPPGTYAGIKAARSLSIPYVIWEGLVRPQSFPNALGERRAMRDNYVGASAVICVSHQNLHVIRTVFDLPASFGMVIPSLAEEAFFAPVNEPRRQELRAAWGVPEDGILCFTAAKLAEIKGYEVLIAALDALRHTPLWQRVRFAWAGEGDLRPALVRHLARMTAERHVTLLGHVWNMPELLDAADIFILPSHAEGMPLVILEAMAKGLSVIATDVGGNKEALGPCGTLISPPTNTQQTAAELVGAIARLAGDADALKQDGKASRARATARFHEAVVTQRLLAVIDEIFEARDSTSR